MVKLIRINDQIAAAAKRLWDYCCVDRNVLLTSANNRTGKLPIAEADCILVFGCQDIGVPRTAAALIGSELAPMAIISGNAGLITDGLIQGTTESAIFIQEMRRLGAHVKAELFEEKEARHTIENIRLSRLLLSSFPHRGVESCIAVTKPYSTRRVLAAVQKNWEGIEWQIAAEAVSFDDYCFDEHYRQLTFHFLVGEIERISDYGKKGDILEQAIPDKVWSCYYTLRKEGFGIDRSEIKAIHQELSVSAIARLTENFVPPEIKRSTTLNVGARISCLRAARRFLTRARVLRS